jgi:hypothetical protein
MLTRLWLCWANKVFVAAMIGVVAIWFVGRGSWVDSLRAVLFAVVATLGVTGAVLGVLVFIVGWRPPCPVCGRPSDPVRLARNDAGVHCDHCGIVHLNVLMAVPAACRSPGIGLAPRRSRQSPAGNDCRNPRDTLCPGVGRGNIQQCLYLVNNKQKKNALKVEQLCFGAGRGHRQQ